MIAMEIIVSEVDLKRLVRVIINEDGVEETLTYFAFPSEHWTRIRTNNAIERLNREIRRRTRVVGCFPDGNSALMLVCARLRQVMSIIFRTFDQGTPKRNCQMIFLDFRSQSRGKPIVATALAA